MRKQYEVLWLGELTSVLKSLIIICGPTDG